MNLLRIDLSLLPESYLILNWFDSEMLWMEVGTLRFNDSSGGDMRIRTTYEIYPQQLLDIFTGAGAFTKRTVLRNNSSYGLYHAIWTLKQQKDICVWYGTYQENSGVISSCYYHRYSEDEYNQIVDMLKGLV